MNFFRKLLCKLFKIGCNNTPPPPTDPNVPSRPGILFGYYGLQAGDAAQIAGHVNFAHIGSWGDWNPGQGRINLINDIIGYGHAARDAGITRLIFTLDFCLFTQTNPRQLLSEAIATQYLNQFLNRLMEENLLDFVAAWYTIDEPNISEIGLSAGQITSANSLIRAVDHTDTPLAVIYGASNGQYPGIASYDWCGFDNYGAPIFTDGQYQHLKNQMNATQKTIIVPGGSDPWRENPQPFYDKAQQDTQVGMIMAFKWFGTDGIGVNGMAPQYTTVGQKIKAANP